LGTWNSIVWGGGHRVEKHEFKNVFPPVVATFFDPDTRTLQRSNVFVQDSVSVTDTLKLILGVKLEKDAYVSPELIPSARVAWKVTDTDLLWGAVSRAVRAPSRLDRDLKQAIVAVNPPTFLLDSGNFQSEKLIAYEVGYRTQWASRASLSVSAFYNVYQDLRSLEPTPVTTIPLVFANEMEGTTYGVEAWGSYRITEWWKANAGFVAMDQHLRFKPGSSEAIGIQSAGDDPAFHASLRSSIDLTRDVTFDAGLRFVGSLPEPSVDSYTELDARLGWAVSDAVSVSLSGFNLLHDRHEEFIDEAQTPPVSLGRSFFLNMQLRF
jgi:iron complex outermembrane receptor protein